MRILFCNQKEKGFAEKARERKGKRERICQLIYRQMEQAFVYVVGDVTPCLVAAPSGVFRFVTSKRFPSKCFDSSIISLSLSCLLLNQSSHDP